MPRAGILCALHRRRRKKNTYQPIVCLFTKTDDSASQNLACKRVKSILEVPCSACHVHCAPRKKACKGTHLAKGSMHPKNWARTARTFFPLDARNHAQTESKGLRCQLIPPPPEEISGIRRNSIAKAYYISPLYSYDFEL